MLKSLTVALLTLGAACATTAFAHDSDTLHHGNGRQDSFQAGSDHGSDKGGSNKGADTDWRQRLDDPCGKHEHCDRRDDRHDYLGRTQQHPAAAPEIDPAGALGALTLLAGGLAVMRGRRTAPAHA